VERLSALISAALGELAAVGAFQLGRSVGDADPSVFAETLLAYTGQRVGEGEIAA
jgi:hypothetical protein